MKYENKNKEVDALQLTVLNMSVVEKWCRGSIKGVLLPAEQRVIDIQTPDGELRVFIGEYVIRDENGAFYKCKSDVFEKTYNPIY